MRDTIKNGSARWFEYHCFESDQSADADLWYRSHKRVTVGDCENKEFGQDSQKQRYKNGTPLVYAIRFEDGFIGSAFEDELLYRRSQFERPSPPPIESRFTDASHLNTSDARTADPIQK